MKNCMGCKYAQWKTTKAGRLHQSGDGRCLYKWKAPPIPACMYWISDHAPAPYGGHINRRKEFKDDCPMYQRESNAPRVVR